MNRVSVYDVCSQLRASVVRAAQARGGSPNLRTRFSHWFMLDMAASQLLAYFQGILDTIIIVRQFV